VFYDNYLKICEEKGISPSRVLNDLKISKGSLSNWKNGSDPLNETKKKIAEILGVCYLSVLRRIRTGELRKTEISKRNFRISESDFQKYISNCRKK